MVSMSLELVEKIRKYFDKAYEIQRYLIDQTGDNSDIRLCLEKHVELTIIQTKIIMTITDMLQETEVSENINELLETVIELYFDLDNYSNKKLEDYEFRRF